MTNQSATWGLSALTHRLEAIRSHNDERAHLRDGYITSNRYFYGLVEQVLRFIVDPGKRVLQLGCQTGRLLEMLEPSKGVGMDYSGAFIDIAREKHPEYELKRQEGTEIPEMEPFDYVLVSNLGECLDVLDQFEEIKKKVADRDTLIVIYVYNRLWEPLVILAEWLGIKYPQPNQNWLSMHSVKSMLTLSGYDPIRTYRTVLMPKYVPLLSWFANRVLAKLPLLRLLCMVNVITARPRPEPLKASGVTVSVIVPCKDEEGNIEAAVTRVPEMGAGTEIIFCDDRSEDGTVAEVRRMQKEFPEKNIKLVDGPGICKAKNVWAGFEAASGDVLMILDADLTVMPEKLPQFFNALIDGRGGFVNGTRMVYPMQHEAMRTLNMIGNKFFSTVFSLILGQSITDTLCGTKVIWRDDWKRLKGLLGTWGIDDRWGDYELLFGAAKLNLKIIDLPVHYQRRIEGETKMSNRLWNASIMMRMCIVAFWKFRMY